MYTKPHVTMHKIHVYHGVCYTRSITQLHKPHVYHDVGTQEIPVYQDVCYILLRSTMHLHKIHVYQDYICKM